MSPSFFNVVFFNSISGWDDWSDWSACNVSCDTGLQYRHRRCLKCGQGHNKEIRKCNDFPCDGMLNKNVK